MSIGVASYAPSAMAGVALTDIMPADFGQVRHFVVAHFLRQFDGGVVQRHRQRVTGGHFAVVLLFVIARLVDLVAVGEGAGFIR